LSFQQSVDQLISKNQRLEKEVETFRSQNNDDNPPTTFSDQSDVNSLPDLSDNDEESRQNEADVQKQKRLRLTMEDIVLEIDVDNERRPKKAKKCKSRDQELNQESNLVDEDTIPKAKKAKHTIGCCTLCKKEMKLSRMQQHLDSHQNCSICNEEYSGRSASARRKQHEKTCRPKIIHKCKFCAKILKFKSSKLDHEKTCRFRVK
jgi:hypothetical protein